MPVNGAKNSWSTQNSNLSCKEINNLKETYKVFIDKITFDKQSKEVAVHLLFGQDFIRKLNHATENEPSPDDGDRFFVLSGEIYLVL